MSAVSKPLFFMEAPFVAEIWSADQGSLPTEAQYGQIFARMFELHEQSYRAISALLNEPQPETRLGLYQKLRQVNDALGIPTDSMEVLGVKAPTPKDWTERIDA